MPRYPRRPWYTPLGFMNSAPTAYAPMVIILGGLAAWPLRYRLSEYFERQRDGPHIELRRKAAKYYNEMERMHRRQALVNQDSIQSERGPQRMAGLLMSESIRMGQIDQEYNYWHAHQRDAIRAEKLLLEVRELKAKLGTAAAA